VTSWPRSSRCLVTTTKRLADQALLLAEHGCER
jgi:hypothetical protein